MKEAKKMKKVLVLFGGVSSEHDISLISAKSVIENIPKDKYEPVLMGITKDGEWYLYNGDVEDLPEDKWLNNKENITPATISLSREDHGIIAFGDEVKKIRIDVVFPVLHGKNGEDGTIQGMLQLAAIPYVGCDMISSACCMDKVYTNTLADAAGVPQAKWLGVKEYDYSKEKDSILTKAEEYLGYPIFVKPANAGSSVGVSKATDLKSLNESIIKAFKEDSKLVLEEGVVGAEVEVAVMGNEEPIASVVGEIEACNDFYDFDAKYINSASNLYIPARISEEKAEEVRKAAVNAYKALGCSGLARVDFFVRHSDGAVMLNEPNTIPGFTSISMYSKLFAAAGVPYPELIDKLICFAIEKWTK